MKQFLILLIFSSLLFSYEIEIGEAKILKNEVEIPIKIKAEEPYTSLQFTIEYDKNEVIYLGFSWGDIAKDGLTALNDKVEGKIKGAIASSEKLKKEGVVCFLKFSKIGKLKFSEFLIDDKPAKIKIK